MRIAVDAMGGDYAPQAIVQGSVDAARAFDVTVVLVGQRAAIEHELAQSDTRDLKIVDKRMSRVYTIAATSGW